MKLGKEEDAISDLRKIISTLDNKYNHFYKGCLKYLLGKNEEATKDFTRSLELDEDNVAFYNDLSYYYRGLSFMKMGKEEKANADFKKACDGGVEDACEELKK